MSLSNGVLLPLQGDGGGIVGLIFLLLPLVVLVAFIAGLWKAFTKAGEPGWAAIIPIYNIWVMVKISDNAWWWMLLFFLPLIQIVATIKISIDVAKQFGQGVGFGIGLWLLPFVFWPLLGFGDYRYRSASAI